MRILQTVPTCIDISLVCTLLLQLHRVMPFSYLSEQADVSIGSALRSTGPGPLRPKAHLCPGTLTEFGQGQLGAKPHCSFPKAGAVADCSSASGFGGYTPLNVLIGASVPDLGCSVPWYQTTGSNLDQTPCWGIVPSTPRDRADRQSPRLRAVG